MSKIYEIFGRNAHEMTFALMEAAQVASMIPSGASIALKPNLVVAADPDDGATTHAGVLSGAISYLLDHGFTDISVIEGSWVGDNTERAFHTAGYDRVCKHYGVPFFDLKRDQVRTLQTPIGELSLCARALDAGFLIDLPVLKGHCQTVMTCALKNLKGCLPDREKRRFHTLGLQKPIAALAAALKPGLVIVDSICGDLDFEEGGTPVQSNRMFLGTDAVQIDAYGAQLMGLDLSEIPYIAYAQQWGAGSAAVNEGDVIRLNEPTAAASARPQGTVSMLTKNVRQDQACSACFAALVRALHTTGVRPSVPVYIGQGWQGQKLEGLGIGKCCRGAEKCVMGCPPTAAQIAEALRELSR